MAKTMMTVVRYVGEPESEVISTLTLRYAWGYSRSCLVATRKLIARCRPICKFAPPDGPGRDWQRSDGLQSDRNSVGILDCLKV